MSSLRRAVRAVIPLGVRRPLGIGSYRAVETVCAASRHVREQILGRLPLLAARDLLYDDHYFESVDKETRELYEALADALLRLWAPRSVVDVGCGTGIVLARLAANGVHVRGMEGSRSAVRLSTVSASIVRANLERGVPDLGRFDLCLCLEVAEHLSPRSARGLIAGLARLSDVVVFSAARPGQPGTAHVNLRPASYWAELFSDLGFSRTMRGEELRRALANVPGPDYVLANLAVYERGGGSY